MLDPEGSEFDVQLWKEVVIGDGCGRTPELGASCL
jgi:hypothetical protein